MSLNPQQRYQLDLQREGFVADVAQEQAVAKLQVLFEQLLAARQSKTSLLSRLFRPGAGVPVRGLYFWGGVGRGKTYLMDNFYESLPFQSKMRVHFHRFMRRVHRDLTLCRGTKNPLEKVAAGIADDATVLCFDEFFVSDITDAMILATLMEQLFKRGVTFVATSNIEPRNLYANGLQRQRFMPAIELIQRHCDVVNVDGGVDYRLRTLQRAPLFHCPLDGAAERALTNLFEELVPSVEEIRKGVLLEVEGRDIPCRFVGEDVAWFDFMALCDGPRSQNDYIELAREFHAIVVSGVIAMDVRSDDRARRFINMIDEFYDRNVKLALSSQVAVEQLYGGGNLSAEFARTTSRLLEMQSREYLARPHRPE